MIRVEVTRSGLDVKAFADTFIARIVKPLLEEAAGFAEREMKERAPRRTGALVKSIRKTIRERAAVIGPTVPYAIYVEYGTRPHEIRPVHARALRFEVAGEVVFATRVWHPGTKPQPFVRETAEETVKEIPSLFRKVWSRAV